MSVVHVTTWAGFKSAVSAQGDTVILDNDIDANGDYISSSISLGASYVQGDGHTIYNISGNTNVFVSAGTGGKVITGVNFANVDTLQAGSGGALFRGSTGSNAIYVRQCCIQGQPRFVAGGYTNVERCAIVYQGGTHACVTYCSGTGPYFNNNYVDLGDNYRNSEAALFTYSAVRNTYIKGDWVLTSNAFIFGNGSSSDNANNVINFTARATSPHTLHFFGQTGGTAVSIYNADKIDSNITIDNDTNVAALTDTEMHDASVIAAAGFPIII